MMAGTAMQSRQSAELGPSYGRVGFGAMLCFSAAGLAFQPPDRLAFAAIGAVMVVASGAELFLWSRLTPALSAAGVTAGTLLLGNGRPSDLGWFAVCIVGGWCALRCGTRVAVAVLVTAGILFGGEWIVTVHDPGWGAWMAGTTFTVVAALLIRHQIELVEQLRVLQADLAQRERAEERTRIAHELHDVIAHALTVSLLHVSSARLAIEHDPSDAARALADAERLTRQSLDDVRATVGMLRSPDDDALAPPAPRLEDVPLLIQDLRAARADVSLRVRGELTDVPSTTGLTAFRIVQEALTNASRHAPGSHIDVCIEVRPQGVHLSVESSGVPGTGSGMGVTNMSQRAEAVGGTLTAGPAGSGWMVTASLPCLDTHGPIP